MQATPSEEDLRGRRVVAGRGYFPGPELVRPEMEAGIIANNAQVTLAAVFLVTYLLGGRTRASIGLASLDASGSGETLGLGARG